MKKRYKILAINPGSTSTKIAVFSGNEKVYSVNVSHDADKLKEYKEIRDQLPFRMKEIESVLDRESVSLDGVDAFATLCGGLVGCEGGVYELGDGMNEILYEHARICYTVRHPNTLGPQIAKALQEKYGGRIFVVNPPDIDELDDVERVTGFRDMYRLAKGHPMNQKENCIRYAASQGRRYEDMNIIVCHLGGGVTVGAHRRGKLCAVNDAVNGDGPMAPTRAGWLPATDVARLCFSGKYSEKDIYDRITKNGGFTDHLGTSDALTVKKMIADGNKYAELIYNAFIYQVAKAVGGCAAALRGRVDAIIITGGMAYDEYLISALTDYISWIAPITVQAGELEMEALAAGAMRVMNGEETTKTYTGIPVFESFEKSGYIKSKTENDTRRSGI